MKKIVIPVFLLCGILMACGPKISEEKADTPDADISEEAVAANAAQTAPPLPTDLYSNGTARLIKTADCRFKVNDMKQSVSAIETAIRKYPAYIASSNLSLEYSTLRNKLSIRVQSEYFQDLLKEIDKQAVVVDLRDISTEDVSKDFVDLDSRLRTKREVEARYTEILRKQAGTMEEVLKVEQQIGALHEDIEATVSRLNYLKDQVRYSTINLELYQTVATQPTASEDPGIGERFSAAFSAGMQGLISITLALTYLWPILVVGVPAVILIVRRKRRKSLTI